MNSENPSSTDPSTNDPITIGVISDTHGLLRPQIVDRLKACSHILHAGDIGAQEVLDQLNSIAPVVAVRGNMDFGSWSNELPVAEIVRLGGIFFYVLHNLDYLDLDPVAADIQVVISGHTHQSRLFEKEGVIYLNPGSAGHRRKHYPVSMATIRIEGEKVTPWIIEIDA